MLAENQTLAMQSWEKVIYSFDDPPDDPGRNAMQFRLVYGGALLKSATGGNTRNYEKHGIRLEFHRQLKRLWETHPLLLFYNQDQHWERNGRANHIEHHDQARTRIADMADRYNGFVPLVNEAFGTYCELDILLLRAEPEADASWRGGDIDNRLKTLFDAFQIPRSGQRGGTRQDAEVDPRPLFVLMEEDNLVSSVKVTADRLLVLEADCDPAEACVIVNVTVKTANPILSPFSIPV